MPPQKHIWAHELAFHPYQGSDWNSIFSYKLTWGIWKYPTIALCWRFLWISICQYPQVILGHLKHTDTGARDIWFTSLSPASWAGPCVPIGCQEPWWFHTGGCLSQTHLTQSMGLLFWGQNVSISYLIFVPHILWCGVNFWVTDSSQLYENGGGNKRTSAEHSPGTPFHFTSHTAAAKQILQSCVKFYN